MRIDLPHLAWAKTEARRLRYGLANSAVAAPDLAALAMPHRAEFKAGGEQSFAELERALGERVGAPGGRVLVAAGTSEANACVLAGLIEPGDQVLVECPGYEPHRIVPELFGAEVRRFERPRIANAGELEARLVDAVTARTRMIIVSHLHNPSGAALSDAELNALERVADAHHVWILSDEVYRDAAPGPLGCCAQRGPRWITTSSLTKSYGLGGLRIGWIAAAAPLLARCAAAQNALSAEVAHPSAALALALVPHLDALRARGHAIVAENRAAWQAVVQRLRSSGFDGGGAGQGVTTWCTIGNGDSGDAFAAFASASFDLAVTPGRFFADPRGFRVSLGGEPPRFAEALEPFELAVGRFVETRAGSGARG